MPVINWDETSPPDDESVGLGDDRIRSLKSSVRVGLDSEHVWPASGGDAGVHRFGSARAHYAAQSLVSSTGTDGRLMQASDTSRLFGVGSGGTTFLGGPTVISAGSFPGTVPQRAIWVDEFGEGMAVGSAGTTVTIPNSGYSGVPFIIVTGFDSIGEGKAIVLTSAGATSFVAATWNRAGTTPSNTSFHWRSIGTRTL